MYRREEVLSYCQEEDVSFIRLVFCDLAGRQKNISILPSELERSFEYGISFDASAIDGFTDEVKSDLFLFPDPSTLSVVPWRSVQDRVIMMFCNIYHFICLKPMRAAIPPELLWIGRGIWTLLPKTGEKMSGAISA